MASESPPSRARSADRLSSIRFINRASGQSFANEASIGTIECFRAWTRVMRMAISVAAARAVSTRTAAGPHLKGQYLLERNRVHQSALGPGAVEAAVELQRARLADIALEDFAVIATGL